MPPLQRGHVRRLPSGRYQLRYYDREGKRRTGGAFSTRSAAFEHYRNAIELELRGDAAPLPELTLRELVDTYLERHGAVVEANTIRTLRHRLARPVALYGDVRLRELARMAGDLAGFRASLSPRYGYAVMSALRQVFAAACRWGYMESNPATAAGPNPQPPAREVETFTLREVDLVADEFGPVYGGLVLFACETGLRPEEWAALERRDVDREAGVVLVERTVVDGVVKPHGKTSRSRRRVPLTRRALDALESVPIRLDSPLLFPSPRGGYLSLRNWRRRDWQPALEAAGLAVCRCGHRAGEHTPGDRCECCRDCRRFNFDTRRGINRTPYALRHTFISNALAAGVPAYDVARYAGTSLVLVDKVYGHLVKGSEEAARERLDSFAGRLGHYGGTAEVASESR